MPITLKLGELVAATPILQRLAQQELPIMAAYKIGVRFRLADVELSTYDKVKGNLIVKLGTQDPNDPKKYSIDRESPNWGEYNGKLAELDATEITLDTSPIQLGEFGDQAKLSIAEAMRLGPLVTE